ncbi:platelet binding protein GspB isoform X2 [Myripristis murdjan]|uniref:platelet binding protein GspB isoform X2 n=1 Tax=Myripristis murdjan TaxID=586833 RepID=UPI0011763DCC|nr:platelet binding protein GspB-like isoform X2 [Myripristis murdjan]
MACTTFIKDTDVLLLLLLGILPSALVSGQTTVSTPIPSVSATTANTASTMTMSPNSASPTTVTSASSASSAASATSGSSGATTTQSATSMTTVAMSAPPTTVATSGSVTTTNSGTASATAVSSTSSAAVSPTMTQTSTMAASGSTVSSSTAASASGSPTSSVSSSAATMTTAMTSGAQTSGNTTGVTSGTTNTTSMSMICCPSFTCNYTDCYSMYTSQNETKCDAGVSYCQLIKQSDMSYIANCSASCVDRCVNETQTNCSVECCDSTGCLNATFASMMMTTTVTPATTTTAPVTTTKATTTMQTTANNGNKCRTATCNDKADCYTGFSTAPIERCSSSHLHCQLKKETVDSKVKWTAGCTTNCSGQTWCKSSSSSPPCHLECCNATKTSCLWLNGTANVPSLATRGPHLHTELIALLVCLLGISSLF